MPRDALDSKNAAAHQHANVPRRCKQTHRTHEKDHSNRNSVLGTRPAAHDFKTTHPAEDAIRQGNQEQNPVQTARFPVSAPGGQPSSSDQINGENPAANVIGLIPHDRQVRREGTHGEHGRDKNLPRQHMPGGSFAERHCRGPGQQPQAPSANMNNQYGRIGHWPLLEIYTWIGAPVFRPTAISTVAIPAVPFLVCDPRAPTPKSSRSSPATSPPTEAIRLSETLCAAD